MMMSINMMPRIDGLDPATMPPIEWQIVRGGQKDWVSFRFRRPETMPYLFRGGYYRDPVERIRPSTSQCA
jgi:hypothetical protein